MSIEREHLKELDYGITTAVQTLIEAMGMVAENEMRKHRGEAPAYVEENFRTLINMNGVHHNAVLARWMNVS